MTPLRQHYSIACIVRDQADADMQASLDAWHETRTDAAWRAYVADIRRYRFHAQRCRELHRDVMREEQAARRWGSDWERGLRTIALANIRKLTHVAQGN